MTRRALVGIDASRGFDGQPTGTERYANAVMHALAERRSYDLRLYMRSAPTQALPPDVQLRLLPGKRLWTHRHLRAELRRSPPDALFVPAHVMPIGCRVPTVVTVHDLGHRHWPRAHTAAQRMYLEWSTRHHVRRAARLIVDSRATREDLMRIYDARPEKIVIAPLGVDERWSPPRPVAIAGARDALGLAPEARYILHVGTIQPRKNLARLVEAFARLAESRPDLQLILVGHQGWGNVNPTDVAEKLGVADRVHIPGYLDDQMVAALYGGAAAVVIPSLHEGFGLPALEAMACGAPVAVSGTSSLPEVVGEAGLQFDPLEVDAIADSIESLLVDEGLRRALVVAGLRRAGEFTWRRTAERVAEAIDGALADTGTAS